MLVDSTKRKLSDAEIMEIAAVETKSEYSPEQVKEIIGRELRLPSAWKTRYGNTIFITHKLEGSIGFIRALNADIGKNYVMNVIACSGEAYRKGYDVLVTQFHDPTILNIFNIIGRNPPRKDMGFAVQPTDDGGYQVTLVLGTLRGAIWEQ